MTREQYMSLKAELKDLAQKIKGAKPEFRKAQSNLSKFQNQNGSMNDYFDGRIKSTQWEQIRPEHEKLSDEISRLRSDLNEWKYDYRHKHIVYSFARGKTMEQIEPKVRQGNEPDRRRLESLMKMYDVTEPAAAA